MTYEDVKAKLDRLYADALEQKNIELALMVLKEMIIASAVDAQSRKSQTKRGG